MIGASNLLAIVSKEDNNSEDIFVYGKQFDKLRLQL